ncbi:MAG: citramalate synthase [Acidimicrobiia bacterium]|nr:citramalate synthase [Acidimicrobiia bacterium]
MSDSTSAPSASAAGGIDRRGVRDQRWPEAVDIFDTTLRDGSQFEGIALTADDKLKIARLLDQLGVHYIEGGWPGANPRDDEFFRRAAEGELRLETSTLVAFGSTRRPKGKVDSDPTLANLLAAQTDVVCIVAKAWDYHVTEALRTTLDEGVAMIADSVRYLVAQGKRVFVDFEHFFDGYKRHPEFTLRAVEAAAMAGAEALVLCDTNGGSLPHEVESATATIVSAFGDLTVGMHTQNDTGCAVANAIAGVRAGATHVQGTINGYGERTGNCDLTTFIPNMTLKMGIATVPEARLSRLSSISHHVAELVNLPPMPQQPYVGQSAFAHKAGLHTSAIARRPDAYEHVDPAEVGNGTRFLVSDLSGRSTLELKAKEMGLKIEDGQLGPILDELKKLEHSGYHFEAADASLELLMRRATGWHNGFFELESFRVMVEHRPGMPMAMDQNPLGHYDGVETEATIKVTVGGQRVIATGEGNGPVNALDAAFRQALARADRPEFAILERVRLTDYKVRIIDSAEGTGAVTRVLIDATDGERHWSTVGVSENIIEASWQALADSMIYALLG